jgi:hypothetical protein
MESPGSPPDGHSHDPELVKLLERTSAVRHRNQQTVTELDGLRSRVRLAQANAREVVHLAKSALRDAIDHLNAARAYHAQRRARRG